MTLVDGMVSAKSTDETNPQASLTADLLNEVFNETNTSIRTAAAEVRVNEALKEMTKLYGVLGHYRRFTDSRQLDNQFLKALLSRESPFASIKRGYVRKHLEEYPELETFLM